VAAMNQTPDESEQVTSERILRFEGTVHPGEQNIALSRVSDLDLDRVPDPQGGVRLLIMPDEIARLLDLGYEVRLYRNVPVEPLRPELIADDEQALRWLEDRVSGIAREERS
jgi:hypothetical protein